MTRIRSASPTIFLFLFVSFISINAQAKSPSKDFPGTDIGKNIRIVTGATANATTLNDTDNSNAPVRGFLFEIDSYDDLGKVRKALKGTGYSVFVCNLDRWTQRLENSNGGTESCSKEAKRESFYVFATKECSPAKIVRSLGQAQLSQKGPSKEEVALLLTEWSKDYSIGVESISEKGIDIEFRKHPKELKSFFNDLAEFDPALIGIDKSDSIAYSKRIDDMISYFKKSKIVTLMWR